MSYPKNRLADFQSYSAMHMLIMTDGIDTVQALRDDPSVVLEVTDDPEELFDLQTVATSSNANSNGKYIVIYDGRRTANWSIDSVEWLMQVTPSSARKDRQSENVLNGKLTMEEPFGAELLEVFTKGTTALEVVPSMAIYLLKTFFVGFDANGQQHMIDDIVPFAFIITDMTMEMTASGSRYEFNTMGIANGASKMPQIAQIGGGIRASIEKGDSLASAMGTLETNINDQYLRYKKMMIQTLQEEIDADDTFSGDAATLVNEKYLDVKYVIKVDPDYNNQKYIVGTNEADTTFIDDKSFAIAFPADATVEECIEILFKSCEELQKEATLKENEIVSYLPNIVSRLVPAGDSDKYVVEYTVYRCLQQYQPLGSVWKPDDGEYLEFDYIYTGKNTDVLEFDMNMKMGKSFLMTRVATTATTATNQQEVYSSTSTSTPVSTGDPHHMDASAGTDKEPPALKGPLYLGQKMFPSDFVSKPNLGTAITFDELMKRQAFNENLHVQLKIVGNVQLLNESLASEDTGTVVSSHNTGAANIFKKPAFVKLNINFPSSKELTGVKKFWYDGWFSIFSIENNFDQGVFTQTLNIRSLPVTSALPEKFATLDEKMLPNPGVKAPTYDVNRADEQTDAGKTTRSYKFGVLDENDNGNGDTNRDPTVDLFRKRTALLAGMGPEITNIYDDIIDVWKEHTANGTGLYKDVVPVITSGNDSKHKIGSLHGKWLAIDLRANNLAASQSEAIAIGKQIARSLSIRIGNDYDVIYETFSNFYNNHIHVEYDPKRTSALNDDGEK